MNAIFERRSIRKYTEKPVPEEFVEKILRAGMAAPSAMNEQPWQFVVIDDRKILDEIPKFHAHAQMLKEAPVAIVVCGDMSLLNRKDYWVQDCSAATQNMLLMAHELGLGAVWLGVYPNENRITELRKLLAMPETIVPFCIISMGFPAETKEFVDRYNPARVHRNKW